MRLGEILIEKFNVPSVEIDKGLQFQERFGGLIGSILLNMGVISEETLIAALAQQLNLIRADHIDSEAYDISNFDKFDDLNSDFILVRRWVPVGERDAIFYFAALNPLDYEVNQYLQDYSDSWQVMICTETCLRELEARYHMKMAGDEIKGFDFSEMIETEIDKLKELASEAPVVNLVNSLISRAVARGASDLHFEPHKNMCRVRFRIDGKLHDIDFLPLNMQLPVASRIKILSGMDIAERRKPQDGQITMKVASQDIDIRVSTLPLAQGESLVLRFLIKESMGYVLERLGFEPDLEKQIQRDIVKTSGVILLSGPTGSGKTTTLYSCLNRINSEDKKIITIENPVEYQLTGINQININFDIGYDFLTALRSILRQDPDIIMIGEIRDGETARVAMQSSLTGHLVFSTIHTNNAATAYTRLIDLNVAEYLINSTLVCAIAQRLVRRVCPECSIPLVPDAGLIKTYNLETIAEKNGVAAMQLKTAKGCPACNQTGFRGRVAILEYLQCTPFIKSLPKDADFLAQVYDYMQANNIRTLMQDGVLKVIKGVTTIDEVVRVCG